MVGGMQRTLSYSSPGSSDLETTPVFNVVIAYEDFEAGKSAKTTYDFLVSQLGRDCSFANQMWKFNVLDIPKLREIAAKDATMADIVVVACHLGVDLPREVKAWIELWESYKTEALALVALFHPAASQREGAHLARSYLAAVAKRNKMEFFTYPEEERGSLPSPEQIGLASSVAGQKALSALAGAVQQDGRFFRWGLNE